MKRIVPILSAFLLISCQKNETEHQLHQPSPDDEPPGLVEVGNEVDSLKQANTFRFVNGDTISKIINGDMLPLVLAEEFTSPQQKFIIKIKNHKAGHISGKITPKNNMLNIRFNQIKLANGQFDGPFGREIDYQTDAGGEIWLIIGKSNMASGDAAGEFTVELK